VVVQGHHRSLLDEEENEAVVLAVLTRDGYPIERALKAVGIVGTTAAEHLGGQLAHVGADLLADWVADRRVQEGAGTACAVALERTIFDAGNKGFHIRECLG
jgi:hypothetical protein